MKKAMTLPTTISGFIFHFAKESWLKFSFIIFTTLFTALTTTIFPYFIKRIVNILENYHEGPGHVYQAIGGIFLLLVLFWILTEVFLELQGITKIYTYPKFRARIREEVFSYVKSHSHEYFSSQLAGTLAQKMANLPNSCENIMEMISNSFIQSTFTVLLVLSMFWAIDPIFLEIILVWLTIHAGIFFIFFRYGTPSWGKHAHSVAVLSGRIVDVFNNISNIRLFVRDNYEIENLRKYQGDEIRKSQRAMWILELARIGMGLAGLLMILGVIFTLIYGWTYGWVTFGDFTQVSMQTFFLLGTVWGVTESLSGFSQQIGTVSDALGLLRKSHDVVDKKNADIMKVTHGKIEVEKIIFSYHRNRPLFNELDLVILPGQKVGLVGHSGSGKSTMANLILRFYDVKSGKILIDGQNIADVTQDSLRSNISMIPQEPILFHRSLMDNIRYGRLDATDDEVIEAAKLAHCEFIEKLDNGFHAVIGEDAVKLSGGQKQRIAIARAILKNAPILILDEATSQLDSVTESHIQESLWDLMQGKTTIVIAHRLSTLLHMDRILVFDKGKIVEDGSHQELLSKAGLYKTLWDAQVGGFLPDARKDNRELK